MTVRKKKWPRRTPPAPKRCHDCRGYGWVYATTSNNGFAMRFGPYGSQEFVYEDCGGCRGTGVLSV